MKLPWHYRDDNPATGELGDPCPYSGYELPHCPLGCSGAKEHYANDGHYECDDET